MGWEMKAYSGDRITLMTPEPDGGMYGENGVKAFVREYGNPTGNDTLYFTGTHRADCRNTKTGLTLSVRGLISLEKSSRMWVVQWSYSTKQDIAQQLGHLLN
jgi:hypothetical protein